MKCKRLCAWLLSLVMMFSLLPVSAAAAGIPDAYKPTINWTNDWAYNDHSLTVEVINEGTFLGTISEEKKHLSATVKLETDGVEVYAHEASGGTYSRNTAKLFTFIGTTGSLKLYTRSTAGHQVTVNYVFDDASGNTKAPVTKSVKYNDTETFELTQDHYDYTIVRDSGDATHKVDTFNRLIVTGGAKNSVFTVTYTPKKNMAYLDQYYKKEGVIEYPKWNKENLSFNGPDVLDNNLYEKAYLIQGGHLTELLESARFLDVDGTIYDFTAAKQLPSDLKVVLIDKVWYDREDAKWYYTSTAAPNIPVPFTSIVNLYYGEKHDTDSEYHDFVATTVDPTCTEKGYTVYKCAYCDKTETNYTDPLNHDWKWVPDDKTSRADSKHYQVCQRCNEKGITKNCKFKSESTGTGTKYTCTVCRYSYTDATTPTETVYVYFQTVNTVGAPINNVKGVKHNENGNGWATLGKLTTEQPVSASKDKIKVGKLGAEVKDVDDDPNTKFERYKVNGNVINGNVGISLIDWESIVLEPNGAADYVGFGTEAWHLNGKVNVYKLSYNANLPDGVDEKAVTGMPDPAYYLPGGDAPVSKVDPELQGYVFGGWYTDSKCKGEAIGTVTVTKDTDLYAKWTPAQPTADLVDDAITIYHKVNSEAEWHGGNAYADASAHQAGRTPTISYKAELDLSKMELQRNKQTASIIDAYGEKPWKNLVEAVKAARGSLAMFSGSEIVLHVQLDKQLSTADIQKQLNKITVTSDWFELSKAGNPVVYDENAQSLTITCVPKDKADEYSSTITLSGLNNLSLTDQAQGELSSGKELNVISKGYIDGTIKITIKIYEPEAYALSPIGYTSHTRELSLIGKSKEDPAKNTAKLKLAAPTYTVTYDGNGADSGKTTDPTAYAYGAAATVLTNGFTRSGYTFTGWNTQADGKGKSCKAGGIIDVTENIVLYAQWSENSSGGGGDDSKTYYYFAIQKVDAQDGHALNGAKFELYQLDKNGKVVNYSVIKTRQQNSKNGIALFSVDSKNSYKGIWYYAEVTAPEGYVLDSTEHKINAKDFFDSRSTAVKYADAVRNYRGTTPDLLNGDDHFAYVVGYQDGCVHPNALITRAETATIFFRLLKDSVRDGNLLTSNTFADVPNDYWANTAISTMAGLGIVQGYNSTAFDPNASITRAEFAAICARFDTGKSSGTQTFSDIKGHWAEKYIERAAELGWIKGFEDGTFRPNDCITRAQAMTMINRVLNRIPEDASDLLPDMNVWPDCNPGDWFYLAVQEATNSHDFKHKAGNYETWTGMKQDPDWTRYEN